MTDIVERLRCGSPYLKDSSAERTMAEAAYEIKRLRAALQDIRELEQNKAVSGEGLFMRALLIARAALEPKP